MLQLTLNELEKVGATTYAMVQHGEFLLLFAHKEQEATTSPGLPDAVMQLLNKAREAGMQMSVLGPEGLVDLEEPEQTPSPLARQVLGPLSHVLTSPGSGEKEFTQTFEQVTRGMSVATLGLLDKEINELDMSHRKHCAHSNGCPLIAVLSKTHKCVGEKVRVNTQ